MQNKRSLHVIEVDSNAISEFVDVTKRVSELVRQSGIKNGICHLYVPHTTAAVTINENADPDVISDILLGLDDIVRGDLVYEHEEGNSTAHIKSSMIGISKHVFIEDEKLLLGTWQGIYFCEFDGPRQRKLYVKLVAD